jgi:hypothetical protein
MHPIAGRKATALPREAIRAVKRTDRRVVTPGETGLPFSPRMLTSTARVVTRASVPPTT